MDNLAKQILKDVALDEIAPRVQKRGPVDHWPQAILLERAAYLKKMARYGDGSASETLREYPRHKAMLRFHSRDSDAEMLDDCAILLCVLAGSAVLATGGSLLRARPVEPGVMQGDSIEGGQRQQLKAGDVVHLPAGLAHQLLVAGEQTVACFAMKIEEAE
jgi:hypothetical protein